MALLNPLESQASSWRSEYWRQILEIRQEEYHESFSLDVQTRIWVFSMSHCCFAFF